MQISKHVPSRHRLSVFNTLISFFLCFKIYRKCKILFIWCTCIFGNVRTHCQRMSSTAYSHQQPERALLYEIFLDGMLFSNFKMFVEISFQLFM